MQTDFTYLSPSIGDIGVTFEDLLEILHEADHSPDNPVVCEAEEVFSQLHAIAEIQGGYAIYDDLGISLESGDILIAGQVLHAGKKVCHLLKGAERAAIFACTAGQGFSDWSKRYLQEGELLKGYIVDALGSVVAEKAMDYIQDRLAEDMHVLGFNITNRYSPGYCNWPVDNQKYLFALLPENVCGITLSPSSLMTPIKSVSGIIGIGENVVRHEYTCEICNDKTCVYRKVKAKNIKL